MRKILYAIAAAALCFAAPRHASAQVNLNSGLMARYSMTGNGADWSGNGHNLTNNGATLTLDRFGNANGAYYFNGSSSLSSTFSTVGFPGMSISAWVKTNNGTPQATIAQVCGNVAYVGRFTSGLFMAGMDGSTSNNSSSDESSTNVSTNNWVFVCATNDGSTTYVYVDGKLENSYNENLYTANSVLMIGGQTTNQWYFTGSIDDIWVYNRAISSTEVMALYAMQSSSAYAAVENIKAQNDAVAVYPNPGNGRFSVSCASAQNMERIEVLDMSGRVVYNANVSTVLSAGNVLNIDLTGQSAGVYMVNLIGTEATLHQRLIIK